MTNLQETYQALLLKSANASTEKEEINGIFTAGNITKSSKIQRCGTSTLDAFLTELLSHFPSKPTSLTANRKSPSSNYLREVSQAVWSKDFTREFDAYLSKMKSSAEKEQVTKEVGCAF